MHGVTEVREASAVDDFNTELNEEQPYSKRRREFHAGSA